MQIKKSARYAGWDVVQFEDNSIKLVSAHSFTKRKLRKIAKNMGIAFTPDRYVDGVRVQGDNTQKLGALVIEALLADK